MHPIHPTGKTCIECRSYFLHCAERGVEANAIRCAFVPDGFDPDDDDIEADALVGSLSSALVRELSESKTVALSSRRQDEHAAHWELLGRCQRWIASASRQRIQSAAKPKARKPKARKVKSTATRNNGKPKKEKRR